MALLERGRGVRGGEQQKGLSAAKVPLLQKLGHLLSNLSASPMVELVLGDPIDGGNGLESKLWRGENELKVGQGEKRDKLAHLEGASQAAS